MRAQLIWLTCAAFGYGTAAASAQSLTFVSTSHTAAAGARGAVSVDLNRDGWLDIATANTGRNTVGILLNRGAAGGFEALREIAVGTGPFDIAAGDLNRDGVPDLAVTTPDAPGVEVLLMTPAATVKSRAVVSTGESRGLTIADVTRDGVPDVVYSDYALNRVVALPGDGSGGFKPMLWWGVGSRPQGVTVADFNHDGFMDIAVAISNGLALTVLQGTATTSVSPRSYSAGRALNVLSAADLNADGWLDLAAASTSTNVVSIFKGSATGFVLAGTRATGSSPRSLASNDFNQDGRPDLVVSNRGSSSVTVLLSRADGSVLPDRWGDLPAAPGARGTVAGDFDNDGRADMATAAEFASSLTMFANDTAFVRSGFAFSKQTIPLTEGFDGEGLASGDFNENGIVDLADDLTLLLDGTTRATLDTNGLTIATSTLAAGDLNRDGHTDIVATMWAMHPITHVVCEGIQIWNGNGRGEFTFGPRRCGMANADLMRLADVDRDGRLDIVVQSSTPAFTLYILRQTDSGFDVTTTPMQAWALDLQVADVNRDGIVDVLTSHRPETLSIRLGDGAGRFAAPANLALPAEAWYFDVADLNHDARPDIAMGALERVTVFLATEDGGWAAPVQYEVTAEGSGNIALDVVAGDYDNDGHRDLFASNGGLLLGNGDGTFGTPAEFDAELLEALPLDWNRDGLLDQVTPREVILNLRRDTNTPPVADAGGDLTITYQGQFAQDDGTLTFGRSSDADLHRLSAEWRDETGAVFGHGDGVNLPARLPGTYTYTLTVRDRRGGESVDDFNVTVLPEKEIVLYAKSESFMTGNWTTVADPTGAEGERVFYPNADAPKVTTAIANPPGFVDIAFAADPTQTYKLWVRLKAQDNRGSNDSIWIQFDGAVDTNGQPNYRIRTAEGLEVNLEECLGCRVSGWGWEDDGWGAVNKNGTLLRFPDGGVKRLRLQVREDGVSVDQIVLSAVKYRTARPGTAKNDTTVLDRTQHWPQ